MLRHGLGTLCVRTSAYLGISAQHRPSVEMTFNFKAGETGLCRWCNRSSAMRIYFFRAQLGKGLTAANRSVNTSTRWRGLRGCVENRWQNPDGDVRADKIFVLLLRCVSHFVNESWKIGESVHEIRCQVSVETSKIWCPFFSCLFTQSRQI